MSLTEKFVVALYDDTTGKGEQISFETERHGDETMSGVAARLIPEGLRRFAEQIARDSDGGASGGEIDAIAGRLKIDNFCKDGDRSFFVVDAHYCDKQLWSDRLEAVDEEDVEFGARWIMSLNEGVFPEGDLSAFIENLADQEILSCRPEPVVFEELVEMVRAHVGAFVAAFGGDAQSLGDSALAATGGALIDALAKIDAARPPAAPARGDSPSP